MLKMERWIKSKMKTTQFGDVSAVWNGAVQIEFKDICSDFASRSKRCRNNAEFFYYTKHLIYSFIKYDATCITVKWDRVQKDEIRFKSYYTGHLILQPIINLN